MFIFSLAFCFILFILTVIVLIVGIIEILVAFRNPALRMEERFSPKFKDVKIIKTQSIFNEIII